MPKKITTIGGGHGTASLVRHLKNQPDTEITSVVAVSDSGGSSLKIRDGYEVIAIGDLRRVLHAMVPDYLIARFANFLELRFQGNGKPAFLDGNPVGNVLLLGLIKQFSGDIVRAMSAATELFQVKHRILPVTSDNVHLCAKMCDGSILREGVVSGLPLTDKRAVCDIFLEPEATILPETGEAICSSDIIVICPGSPFTSTAANLCVKGVPEAIRASKAKLVYVVNAMTNRSESPDWTASRHAEEMFERIGRPFDLIICHDGVFTDQSLLGYAFEGSYPVQIDILELRKYALDIVVDNLCEEVEEGKKVVIRHSRKLAEIVASL